MVSDVIGVIFTPLLSYHDTSCLVNGKKNLSCKKQRATSIFKDIDIKRFRQPGVNSETAKFGQYLCCLVTDIHYQSVSIYHQRWYILREQVVTEELLGENTGNILSSKNISEWL